MSKRLIFILIALLLFVLFVIAPLLLPGEESYSEEEYSSYEEIDDDDDFDIDLKKKKSYSARSVGGSKSFRSGK